MQAALIAVGNELLNGRCTDSNSSWMAARLYTLGISVTTTHVVQDDIAAIVATIQSLSKHNQIIIVTGGLGPTLDDLTREAVAESCAATLIIDKRWQHLQEANRAKRGLPAGSGPERQARYPENGKLLTNPCGTAGGIAIVHNEVSIFSLPGVPSEMRAMFDKHVFPALQTMQSFAGQAAILSLCGLPESDVSAIVEKYIPNPEPSIQLGIYARGPVVKVHLTEFEDSENAKARLQQYIATLEKAFGPALYSKQDETLWAYVIRLLQDADQTLATAESCTGGLIGHLLTSIPGVSKVYIEGCISYSNEAKIRTLLVQPDTLESHGAVSEAIAKEMAVGMRKHSGADFALSVTGIAGPHGGSADKPIGLVYTALADSETVYVCENHFLGSRDQIRMNSAVKALDMLRRRLQGMAIT